MSSLIVCALLNKKSTLGVHPHDAKSWNETTEQSLRDVAANAECVAIGECGLDFNRNFSPPEVQLKVFERQVKTSTPMDDSENKTLHCIPSVKIFLVIFVSSRNNKIPVRLSGKVKNKKFPD
jgi:Tat protein secretion system quality control protein TatD with DNase activity